MAYLVNDNCVLCPPLRCQMACSNDAIWFDGEKFSIDNNKCTQCGKCMEVCMVSAIVDTDAPPTVHKPHDIIRRDCDLLILGGGTVGIIAAAKAADMSKKKIIVLEKAKIPGGSGWYAAFIRLFSTKWQLDAGIPDQIDDYIRAAMNVTRWELNPKLVANCFRALPAFFDWFCTWGKAEEVFVLEDSPLSMGRKSPQFIDREEVRSTRLMRKLINRCTEKEVEILTEHAATEFIMGDSGEIAGVIARDPGGTTIINCNYCMVATGNLINCTSLMARCVPEYADALMRRSAHRLPTNTGDGVMMAERAGIPIDYNSICVTYTGPNSSLAEPQLKNLDFRGEVLNVNLNGERWVNETYASDYFFPVLLKQPKCTFFSVMDSKILSMEPLPHARTLTEGNRGGRNVEAGVPDLKVKDPEGRCESFPGIPRIKIDLKELERIASLPGRHLVIADTIEELADKMGVDRKTFIATVKRYNELCAKGHDDDYLKPAKYMLPIEKAPFYASNHFMGMDGAVGGLAVNENMQVMGDKGPIENLYAAGDTTGSRYTNHGGERIEIVYDMSWAVGSAYVAGENIAKKLKKQ